MESKYRELLRQALFKSRDDNKLEPLRLSVVQIVEQKNRPALLMQKRLITADMYPGELFLEANKIVDEGLIALQFNEEHDRDHERAKKALDEVIDSMSGEKLALLAKGLDPAERDLLTKRLRQRIEEADEQLR